MRATLRRGCEKGGAILRTGRMVFGSFRSHNDAIPPIARI